jgi:hypothetical protein
MSLEITNLTLDTSKEGIATLKWSVSETSGFEGFLVEYKEYNGVWSLYDKTGPETREISLHIVNNVLYSFRVEPIPKIVWSEVSGEFKSGSVVTKLSTSKEMVEIASIPQGTEEIQVAAMKNLAGEGIEYTSDSWFADPLGKHLPVTQKIYTPKENLPVVDMLALKEGKPVGNWAGRIETIPHSVPIPPVEKSHKVIIAVNDGAGWGLKTSQQCIGAGITAGRCSGSAETPASMIAAGFKANESVVITQDVGDAKAAIGLGVKLIEYGNERYLKESPEVYGAGFVAWANALQGLGVTLLFNGYGGTWVAAAVAAQPTLKTLIGGVSFHPYGPVGKSTPGVFGFGHEEGEGAMEEMHSLCVTLGIENPAIYITEWGQELEGSQSAQAAKTKAFMAHVLTLPYVEYFAYYQTHDDSTGGTGQWGLFDASSTPREVFQVVFEYAKM